MLARNLPQLRFLHMVCCEELEEIIEMDQNSIASSSSQGHLYPVSFPSLESDWIARRSNLKGLFPISVTHSLSNLKSLDIRGACKLEHVFGYQGELPAEDDEKRIVFLELKRLELSELPNLKSFAPMGYNFQFPLWVVLK
ncbi:hypothetical protein DITRI_Ditri01bG0177700 [Diplodiscus trichospermus]